MKPIKDPAPRETNLSVLAWRRGSRWGGQNRGPISLCRVRAAQRNAATSGKTGSMGWRCWM
jgi:hypothetical protein